MSQAVAHMKQLLDLGCEWVEAVKDTVVAYEVDQFALQAEFQVKFP